MICFKNAQIVESIPILDRAFHYGDGCFTTARFHQNMMELESRHRERLRLSAERLSLSINFDLLDATLEQLKQQMAPLNGTLKIILSRGEGNRGYSLPDHPADLYVLFYPQQTQTFQLELIDSNVLEQVIGLTMPSLVGIKSLNRLEQVLLKKEAQQHGWLEALVIDVQEGIVEGISSNCFIRINDTWITPELRYNGVHGVMRAEILNRMQQQQIPCVLRFVGRDEIPEIQSLFFCNALNPMKVVQNFQTRLLEVQPCVELFDTLQLNQFNHYA
ncbi:aminodeoxychorismate lyase [Acinetobacter sp. ANC 4648]|uniref:aminodeoxychorismate lyase n=1 Tax=Acinetobacter sp. ANC 4648 TaxID=1977875 RepID=UPI000A3317D4|nr:aminodeoxychorismate lyase [Acinetobacter sp. ANC 4648]OTG81784.1 aminodeoxychorismate lyase [Acinetobacter sp. ANC 4648]